MKTNPLQQLEALGQSIWMDYIKRDMFTNDKLKNLIAENCLKGMTSNPDIFEKSIVDSTDYDEEIKLLSAAGKNAEQIYAALTQKDVQDAADEFRDIYENTNGKDGYVSLEVNPHLALDTQGTIEEARHLWKMLHRPNVMIKIPATREGLPAIRQLISEGINLNVTLLFGLDRYREVAEAYIGGLEDRIAKGKPIDHIASVASFFLSRIDVLIDPMLEKQNAKPLQGQVAVASAKMAYQIYLELFNSARFKELIAKGAAVQRLLWASTGTKNPDYSPVKYVDSLIGPETVNTVPPETLNAYRDHGDPKARLQLEISKAVSCFEQLPELGIKINDMTQQLENEGVVKFNKAYDKLIAALQEHIAKA